MSDEPLQQIFSEMRARIQAELDAQIQNIRDREAETIARTRHEAEAEADRRWALKVDAVKAEWAARLQSEIAMARAEAEKRLVAESMRLRSETDQALALERERAATEIRAERQRAEQELRETRAAVATEQQQLELAAVSMRAEIDPGWLPAAIRSLGDARSLSDTLSALVRGAAALAPRVALFVVNGTRLDEWPVAGHGPMSSEPIELHGAGMLRTAVTGGARVSSASDDRGRTPPLFAVLPTDREAMAIPLMLAGQAVAVLYADEGLASTGQAIRVWVESLEVLARYAEACLARLTAVRSLQVLQAGAAPRGPAQPAPPDDEQSARRYAKLLVSEIKLYNEGAVRVGREQRDLSHRLRAEIELARRLYEERVSPSVSARASFFEQELIHTLAGGDPALLGR